MNGSFVLFKNVARGLLFESQSPVSLPGGDESKDPALI